ncbi:MAG: hypothetical protein HY675_04815 [Chloroflexi bacterium]|nr:hypothetical protein [Chloroflexota bacterium]
MHSIPAIGDTSVEALYALPPFWVLVLLLTTLHALLFRLIVGQQGKSLITYWIAGFAGFFLGQVLGEKLLPGGIYMLGDVHVVESSTAAWVLILLANRTRV